MILQAIGESRKIAHSELALQFAASVETLSRRLASARRAGLVQVDVADRKHIYSLTSKGKQLLEEVSPHWDKAQQRLRHSLGEEDWRLLASFTERLTEAAIRAESAPSSKSNGGNPSSSRLR